LIATLVVLFLAVSPAVGAATLRAVVPVAGSTDGAFGSKFRTSVQLHNRSEVEMRGSIVIRAAGIAGTPGDPSIPYVLAPHQTISHDDFFADAGLSGLVSMDFEVEEGGVPTIVARVFDEKGDELGTTGVGVRAVSPKDAIAAGETATLIAPPDTTRLRFAIGARTLGEGVRMRVVVRDGTGALQADLGEMGFPPHFFVQRPATEFLLGAAVEPSGSVAIEVIEGSVIIYGTSTDNKTNDPSVQIVRPEEN
jgi:hypothetical protein